MHEGETMGSLGCRWWWVDARIDGLPVNFVGEQGGTKVLRGGHVGTSSQLDDGRVCLVQRALKRAKDARLLLCGECGLPVCLESFRCFEQVYVCRL